MTSRKKDASPIVLDNIVSIGEPFISKIAGAGWLAVTGHVRSDPDRHATVFFTNPANARKIAQALISWADAAESIDQEIVS
jgi:hypothetical protein